MANKSDNAEKILKDNGYTGRGLTMLTLNLNAALRERTAESVRDGEDIHLFLDTLRNGVEKSVSSLNLDKENPIWENRDAWESGMTSLDFDYLDHTFTGDVGNLEKDAKVFYMLSALHSFAWWQTQGDRFGELFGDLKPEMEKLVPKLHQKNFEEVSNVAKEFFESPLAQKIHDKAQIASEKYPNASSKHGGGIDNLLESHQVARDPTKFMDTARKVYEKNFGLKKSVKLEPRRM